MRRSPSAKPEASVHPLPEAQASRWSVLPLALERTMLTFYKSPSGSSQPWVGTLRPAVVDAHAVFEVMPSSPSQGFDRPAILQCLYRAALVLANGHGSDGNALSYTDADFQTAVKPVRHFRILVQAASHTKVDKGVDAPRSRFRHRLYCAALMSPFYLVSAAARHLNAVMQIRINQQLLGLRGRSCCTRRCRYYRR